MKNEKKQKKIPARDPERAYVRDAVAKRRPGRRRCACGEGRARALIADRNPIICLRCDRKARGQSTEDVHHVAGEANDPELTFRVDTNDHYAILTVDQEDWPPQTRNNPDGSPVLAWAAKIRGWISAAWYLIVKCLVSVAEGLEALDAWLVSIRGRKYWKGTVLERFAPGR